jgi:hypothetical protein
MIPFAGQRRVFPGGLVMAQPVRTRCSSRATGPGEYGSLQEIRQGWREALARTAGAGLIQTAMRVLGAASVESEPPPAYNGLVSRQAIRRHVAVIPTRISEAVPVRTYRGTERR